MGIASPAHPVPRSPSLGRVSPRARLGVAARRLLPVCAPPPGRDVAGRALGVRLALVLAADALLGDAVDLPLVLQHRQEVRPLLAVEGAGLDGDVAHNRVFQRLAQRLVVLRDLGVLHRLAPRQVAGVHPEEAGQYCYLVDPRRLHLAPPQVAERRLGDIRRVRDGPRGIGLPRRGIEPRVEQLVEPLGEEPFGACGIGVSALPGHLFQQEQARARRRRARRIIDRRHTLDTLHSVLYTRPSIRSSVFTNNRISGIG